MPVWIIAPGQNHSAAEAQGHCLEKQRIENTSLAFHDPDAMWVRKAMQRTSSQLMVMLALNLTLYV